MCLNDVTAVRRTVEDDFKRVKTSRERWQVLQDRVKQVTSKVGIYISLVYNWGKQVNPNLKCSFSCINEYLAIDSCVRAAFVH